MALMPCSSCGNRFKGEARNIYLQHFIKDQVESYRHFACSPCAEDILGPFRRQALYRTDDGDWELNDGDEGPKWLPAVDRSSSRRK